MIIVLADTAPHEAEHYAAILAGIAFNPARFRELPREDVEFARDFLHGGLLRITAAMDRMDHTDAEREAAVARALASHPATLSRSHDLATHKMRAGAPLTLDDYAAVWVCECAIKNQLTLELQRREASLN